MKFNLGAGLDIQPKEEGWVNVDIRSLPGIDVVADVRDLPFESGSADELLCNDILEHIPPADVARTLTEWRRVLRPGGMIRLRIPDLKRIARRFLAGSLPEDEAMLLIYGDQSPEWGGTEWGSHKAGYTDQQITDLLAQYDLWVQMILSPVNEHALYVTAVAGDGAKIVNAEDFF